MNEPFYGLKDALQEIDRLNEHIEGIENERDIYLQYFDYIGVDVTWVTTFVRALNQLEIDWHE